jgi:hypothetical protein
MRSPFFLPTCPYPDCGARNKSDARFCAECGYRLYPNEAEIETARRQHEETREAEAA